MEVDKIKFFTMDTETELESVEKLWCELLLSSNHRYFQSWEWISVWLDCIHKHRVSIDFVYGTISNKIVGAFFVASLSGIENKIIYAKRGFVNSSGQEEFDSITVEHNRILIDNETDADAFYRALIEQVFVWDELVLPTSTASNSLSNLRHHGYTWFSQYTQNSYWIDFNKLGKSDTGLLGLLSRNKRYQLRRSIRGLEKQGKLSIVEAETKKDAMNFLLELMNLHQKYWRSKGEAGAFSSIFFKQFHEKLIDKNFNNGHLKLLKMECGGNAVGYFYYFAYAKTVYFYQSGINYDDFGEFKPGIVFHLLAVEYFRDKNFLAYDFLAGDDAYKKSFSTDNEKLHWARIRKPLLRFALEDKIRTMKSTLLKG